MAGNIYTNDYAIKSNESVGGTLRLQQGGTKLNIHNTFTNIQFGTGRKDFGQGATIEINSGSTYGSLIRAEANEVQINATTATLFGDVYFERAINFGTGATAVAFDGDLYDLRDVQLSSPSAGQVLKYNGTKWVNGTDSASTGTGVDSIIAGLGIHVTTSTRDITITNIGVQSLTASNGLVVNKGTGTVNVSIGNLPIQEGDGGAIVVDTSTFGTTKISVDYVELFDHIVPGPGIYKQVNEQNKTITISTTGTGFEVLSDHLYTVGFDIRGENNPLNIRAGQVYIGTETRQSIISMPVNTDMRIYSDYGIVLDTPDDESIQILSPFTVSHRTGQSRISTDAVGNTRLNDQFIYITATNRIVLNTSIVKDDSIKWQLATGIGHVLVEANTATISGQLIKLASTDRTRVGSDVYHSRIGVQDITNFNDTGPPTVSKGIQFQDQTVQRTAYIGGLDFGAITAPATNMEQFLLQLQSVDFGTFTQPSTYAFDAGQIE
jgi:hypothetical protein